LTVKKQLTFAAWWTGIYTTIFNITGGVFLTNIVDIVLATSWVFLLFLVATYSRIFFFTVMPTVFVTSGMVAYAERLMNTPISRDVVASVFETNWEEIQVLMYTHAIPRPFYKKRRIYFYSRMLHHVE
jgi:glucan phosphoethanolaminetransferase (alkaline phosphatase superfamily)